MSKPATQSRTAPPSTSGGQAISPRMATHAAKGASINAAPSQKCDKIVNRLE